MPDFLFFKKGRQIVVADRKDQEAATQLISQGYEKQFEEVTASSAENALKRFHDIRKDQEDLEYGFLTGGIFGLVTLLVR